MAAANPRVTTILWDSEGSAPRKKRNKKKGEEGGEGRRKVPPRRPLFFFLPFLFCPAAAVDRRKGKEGKYAPLRFRSPVHFPWCLARLRGNAKRRKKRKKKGEGRVLTAVKPTDTHMNFAFYPVEQKGREEGKRSILNGMIFATKGGKERGRHARGAIVWSSDLRRPCWKKGKKRKRRRGGGTIRGSRAGSESHLSLLSLPTREERRTGGGGGEKKSFARSSRPGCCSLAVSLVRPAGVILKGKKKRERTAFTATICS